MCQVLKSPIPAFSTGEFVVDQALVVFQVTGYAPTTMRNNDPRFVMPPLLLRLPTEILSAATSALAATAMLRLRMTCTELCALATTNCKTPSVFGHIGIARKVGDDPHGVDPIADGMAFMMLCCCSEL